MRLNRFTAALVVVFLLILASLQGVNATKPGSEHKVTICHAIPPDTAANGYIVLTPDIAANGHLRGGHATQHDADIIPPYTYHDFSYPGKNWNDQGQAIYRNGCVAPGQSEEPSATPSEEPSSEPSEEPSTAPSEEPSVAPSEEPSTPPSEAPSASAATPPELPQTDASSTTEVQPNGWLGFWLVILVIGVGMVGFALNYRRTNDRS